MISAVPSVSSVQVELDGRLPSTAGRTDETTKLRTRLSLTRLSLTRTTFSTFDCVHLFLSCRGTRHHRTQFLREPCQVVKQNLSLFIHDIFHELFHPSQCGTGLRGPGMSYGTVCVLHVQLYSEFTTHYTYSLVLNLVPGIVTGTKRDCTCTVRTVVQ